MPVLLAMCCGFTGSTAGQIERTTKMSDLSWIALVIAALIIGYLIGVLRMNILSWKEEEDEDGQD